MCFLIPTAALAEAIEGHDLSLDVGGIVTRFEPLQVHALRVLLHRVSAWPPARPARAHDRAMGSEVG
jgi:hypothetical protein